MNRDYFLAMINDLNCAYLSEVENIKKLLENDDASVRQAIGNVTLAAEGALKDVGGVIPTFFSNDFIKPSISRVYQAIKTNSHPYNKIAIIDLNLAVQTYNEYFDGMKQYIEIAMKVKSGEIDTEKIKMKATQIATKDMEFIRSIMGGEENPLHLESIDDAMKQVETLIDQISVLTNVVNDIHSIGLMANDYVSEDELGRLKVTQLSICYASIVDFNIRYIKAVINTYFDILASLEKRTPAQAGEPKPKYRLF